GLGNDIINVLGDVTTDIISNDLLGASGLINHSISSNGVPGSIYNAVTADGVAVNVIKSEAGSMVHLEETGGQTIVSEDGVTDTYTVMLTQAPVGIVYVTVSAAIASDQDRSRGSENILVSKNGTTFRKAVVLVFDSSNWNTPQQVTVKAINDA